MAYQVLYRKWRPLIFNDVVGQEHVVSTLKNEIVNNMIAHAYLFCGTRGTGKTSVAKIFSRAINCLNNKDGNPCNECAVCKGILDGSIMDVEELDAASNNGVDNIREIREKVIYSTAQTKYKVFIIDEVHMLSSGAFNALLKTLEEPPEHVIFILATTEYHKIPITILSRCQCFDFKRITAENIAERLRYIAKQDNLAVTEDGLNLVAQLGDGSMRDSLSILDQCVASCGTEISYDSIIRVLGISDFQSIFEVAGGIISNDPGVGLTVFNRVIEQGKNPANFIEMLLSVLRDVMICKITKDGQSILAATADRFAKLQELAKDFSVQRLNFCIDILSKALNDGKWAQMPRTVYELALVKCSTPKLDTSPEAILARMSQVEDMIKSGDFAAALNAGQALTSQLPKAEPEKQKQKVQTPPAAKNKSKPVSKPLPEGKTVTTEDFVKILDYIKSSGELPTFAYASQAKFEWDNGSFVLVFPDHAAINKTIIEKPASMEIIHNAIVKIVGGDCPVECYLQRERAEAPGSGEEMPEDKFAKLKEKFPDIVEIEE